MTDIYCGYRKEAPKGQTLGTQEQCIAINKVSQYGRKAVQPTDLLDKKEKKVENDNRKRANVSAAEKLKLKSAKELYDKALSKFMKIRSLHRKLYPKTNIGKKLTEEEKATTMDEYLKLIESYKNDGLDHTKLPTIDMFINKIPKEEPKPTEEPKPLEKKQRGRPKKQKVEDIEDDGKPIFEEDDEPKKMKPLKTETIKLIEQQNLLHKKNENIDKGSKMLDKDMKRMKKEVDRIKAILNRLPI